MWKPCSNVIVKCSLKGTWGSVWHFACPCVFRTIIIGDQLMTDEIPCYTEPLEEIYLEPLTCSRDILLKEPLLLDSEAFFLSLSLYRAVMTDQCFNSFLISIASTLRCLQNNHRAVHNNSEGKSPPSTFLSLRKKREIKHLNCRNLSKKNNIFIFGTSDKGEKKNRFSY